MTRYRTVELDLSPRCGCGWCILKRHAKSAAIVVLLGPLVPFA